MAGNSSSSSPSKKGKGKAAVHSSTSTSSLLNGETTTTTGGGPARRQVASSSSNGNTTSTSVPQDTAVPPSTPPAASSEFPEIQVNKWSLHDLKQGCDDALKQYLSQPSQFRASNVHTDVRLVLGWKSSLIAIGAALYAYKVGKFQETRPVVLSAVVVFVFLTAVMNLYAKYVEKDVVFVGRRKVFAGRIETQTLTIRSNCEPYTPIYKLSISYAHTTNAGKSIIKQLEREISKPFNEMYDVEGILRRRELERVIDGVLEEAGAVPAVNEDAK